MHGSPNEEASRSVTVGQFYSCQAASIVLIIYVESPTSIQDLWQCRDLKSGKHVLLETRILQRMRQVYD